MDKVMDKQYKVFIDGEAGTTGLQIKQRLANHPHINIISIDPALRKDIEAKKALMQEADITVLCLPDAAAKEAAIMAQSLNCRVIDASSAHRTNSDWTYGLAELSQNARENIKSATLVSNPGCYATGANLLLKPLTAAGLLKDDATININAVSGYSGGGNGLIDTYESSENPSAYALYGMNFAHKHIPEICHWSELKQTPNFFPSVVNLKQGMLIQIPLNKADVTTSGQELEQCLKEYYQDQIFVRPLASSQVLENNFFHVEGAENSNFCDVAVISSDTDDRHLLIARLDNLGKGASGAAVQNLNIMLGLDESICVDL